MATTTSRDAGDDQDRALASSGQISVSTGNYYASTCVSGNATAIQGNFHGNLVHNHYHAPQPEPKNCFRTLWQSLSFDRMDARLWNVATPLLHTSTWLQSHDHFIAWSGQDRASEHRRLLWLRGKPGSGKSTIMKQTLIWARRRWQESKILSYFFNARAPGILEKSTLGLYRSLIYQLLSPQSDIQTCFSDDFASKVRDGNVEDWTEMELQNFLLRMVNDGYVPEITIFVDALDEGEVEDMRRMVSYFEEVADSALHAGTLFRLCMSSRHYPEISCTMGETIIIEDQLAHTLDIELYVQKRLRGKYNVSADDLPFRIIQKSAGVFLWVALIVRMLNQLHDRGRSKNEMFAKLETTPPDLQDVFVGILTKEPEGLAECRTLLQLVLVAEKPLGLLDLYIAIRQYHGILEVDELCRDDLERKSRYVLDCCRGLLETTNDDDPKVQFIHETVRDTLLQLQPASNPQYQSESILAPAIFTFETASCHIVSAKCCLGLILNIFERRLPGEPWLYPFFSYALEYWWQHLEASRDVCDDATLHLTAALLMKWSKRLVEIVTGVFATPWDLEDLIFFCEGRIGSVYYAAHLNVPKLLTAPIFPDVDLNCRVGRYGTALQAASAKGYTDVACNLLDRGADVNMRSGRFETALGTAVHHSHLDMVRLLLSRGVDKDTVKAGTVALRTAAESGYWEILDFGADVNTADGAVWKAAFKTRDLRTIRTLVPRAADSRAAGRAALSWASAEGDWEFVQELSEVGVDVTDEEVDLNVPAHHSVWQVVQVLLAEAADVSATERELVNLPSAEASSKRPSQFASALFVDGGFIESGRGLVTNLISNQDFWDLVQVLLDNVIDVTISDELGNRTPLHVALMKDFCRTAPGMESEDFRQPWIAGGELYLCFRARCSTQELRSMFCSPVTLHYYRRHLGYDHRNEL